MMAHAPSSELWQRRGGKPTKPLGGLLDELGRDAGQDQLVVRHQDLAVAHGEEVPRRTCGAGGDVSTVATQGSSGQGTFQDAPVAVDVDHVVHARLLSLAIVDHARHVRYAVIYVHINVVLEMEHNTQHDTRATQTVCAVAVPSDLALGM